MSARTAGPEAGVPVITDSHEGRAAVIAEVRRRWCGPLDGEDEILHRSPVYAYLVGTLYPVEHGGAASGEDDALDEADDPADAWAEVLESMGEDDFEDASLDDVEEDSGVNLTGAFGWAPQSIGSSFVHDGTTVRVRLSAGAYDRVAPDEVLVEGEPDAGGPRELWKRRPTGAEEFIDVSASGSIIVLDGMAKLSWRSRHHRGHRLTTVALSNAASVPTGEAKRHPDLCLFQVEMTCTDDEGLLPYPQSDVHATEEDRELAFRFRDKPAFAVGHGTAVDWEPSERPTTVRTHTIPEVETRPIRAKKGSGQAVRMRWLADESVDPTELVAGLTAVAHDYETWINGQAEITEAILPTDRSIAQTIVARQRDALRRMQEGIRLLGEDDVIRTAFRMANTAMRWQMLRQADADKGAVAPGVRYGATLSADRGEHEPEWRPFQLAFILASLASTVDEEHPDRDLVDLIWFPTGGGKTEAYLGLAATEMIRRRLVDGHRGGGMAVLTRYTMRLLTAQQFQRAATLICALELMREDDERLDGTPAFSIGLWLGNSTTPGTFRQAKKQLAEAKSESRPNNPFQLLKCPWCGHAIMPERRTAKDRAYGVRASDHGFSFFCPDEDCPFSEELPVQVVDQGIYGEPPTMLVATVDKLARLAWIPEGGKLFGVNRAVNPPSLVIQDELHLLSGPLGTIVGVYEAAIAALLSWKGTAPKIVASTATTRASERQVKELMGRGRLATFPPAGLDADDNHFSEPDPDPTVPGRTYLGIMPQAHTPSWAIGQLSTELLDAPVSTNLGGTAEDAYSTLVVYHNSLRELGRTVTILRDDVPSNLARRREVEGRSREIRSDGVQELNGNVASDELIRLLGRLERPITDDDAIDALATTNILSVGIDVGRLGVMLVNGHTKTTSEYIQATSRVGRGKTPGLVVTMFRSGKPRDRSVFESFTAYHRAFYRFVEPSSVTPWSTQARRRALRAALVILVRHGAGLSGNGEADMFDADSVGVRKAVSMLKQYVSVADETEAAIVSKEIDEAVLDWEAARERVRAEGEKLVYSSRTAGVRLMRQFTDEGLGWPVMNSMRNVDRVVKIRAKGERRG